MRLASVPFDSGGAAMLLPSRKKMVVGRVGFIRLFMILTISAMCFASARGAVVAGTAASPDKEMKASNADGENVVTWTILDTAFSSNTVETRLAEEEDLKMAEENSQANDNSAAAADAKWNRKYKQFNLHQHLTTPMASELQDGISNSRRLAHNHVRLGIAEDHHRELVAKNPPQTLVTPFEEGKHKDNPNKSSEGPRLVIDEYVKPLPFGNGPGAKPYFPKATKEFWNGSGGPKSMWETIACPVADVEKYLENPMRCVIGDGDGTIMATIDAVKDFDFAELMKKTVIPLAKELIWNFTGFGVFEKVFGFICDAIGTLESIVNSVGGAFEDAGDWLGDLFGRRLQGSDNSYDVSVQSQSWNSCSQAHNLVCSRISDSDSAKREKYSQNCLSCFDTNEGKDDGFDCDVCKTCYRPYHEEMPTMGGLCLPIIIAQKLQQNDKIVPIAVTQMMNTLLLSRHIEKNRGVTLDEIKGIISSNLGERTVEDILDDKGKNNKDHVVKEIKENVVAAISGASNSLTKTIQDTCHVHPDRTRRSLDSKIHLPPVDPPGTRDGEINEILQSDGVRKTAAEQAAKLGISEAQVKEALAELLQGLGSENNNGLNDVFMDAMAKDPNFVANVAQEVKSEFDRDPEKYERELSSHLLKSAIDPKTKLLDTQRLRNIQETLANIRKGNSDSGLMGATGRNLGDGEDACNAGLKAIKTAVQKFIGDVLEKIIDQTDFADVFNGGVDDEDIDGLLLMPTAFVKSLDPFQEGGVMFTFRKILYKVYQKIAGTFLFGECHANGDLDCRLPSEINEVIKLHEDSKGDYYLASGCDGGFSAELVIYNNVWSIIESLLKHAGDAVMEFLNLPIKLIHFLIDAVKFPFTQMQNSCNFLGGWVSGARTAATYENSRYALRELACRDLDAPGQDSPLLKRGYGCDGIDNTCDDNSVVDECDEDIFPPDLDITLAYEFCLRKTFSNEQEGIDCILDRTLAEDDCRPVEVTEKHESVGVGTCATLVEVSAIAQGCVDSSPEGHTTTTKSIQIQVDTEEPVVECGFHDIHQDHNKVHVDGGYLFHYNTPDDTHGLAISSFLYTVTDNCENRDIDVDIVVRSNEREQGETAMLAPYQFTDVVKQVEFLYAPTSCELEPTTSPNCIKDIGIATRIRFYEIAVTATDSAGGQDTDTCHVIIVPQCGLDNTSGECEDVNGISYLKKEHLKDLTKQSRIRFELATSKLVWGFGNLDQNFDDLHDEYNSRLVASGWPSTEPSLSPSDEPSLSPSDEPSNEPSISKGKGKGRSSESGKLLKTRKKGKD